MKIKSFSLALFLTLVSVTSVFADPPSPSDSGTGTGNGFPIDQNLIFLMIGGLILGIAVLYRNKIKKASV